MRDKSRDILEIENQRRKITALSNRRLSVHYLPTYTYYVYNLDWSIDRITIVGKMKYDLDHLTEYLINSGFAKEVGRNRYVLVDAYEENIAYFELVKFYEKENKGRIDFNPNRLGTLLSDDLKGFIHELFEAPHFS